MLQAIKGVETHLGQRRQFRDFVENLTTRRAVERELEILGEAINRILKLDPAIPITDAKGIVYSRNRIIHGYDTVDEVILWKIIVQDLPLLKAEVMAMLDETK